MKGTAAAQTPVIIAVGEIVDRPDDPGKALEPVALMAEALRRAAAETPAALDRPRPCPKCQHGRRNAYSPPARGSTPYRAG